MDKKIQFRMVAYTGAAGKSDPSAPNGGNEDNFYVDDDISDDTLSHFEIDKVVDMGQKGLILAVADGMGGQNAGEVASDIAVKTIRDFFDPQKISEGIALNHKSRANYMEKLVVEADRRIKEDSKNNSEHDGMGSTIILAWIVGDQLTLTWCGDSRAYRFNPINGIEPLSKDHSYVQELADKGVITYEDTFDHPQGNIVTRSLGDQGSKAKPESRQFTLYKDDIILLCSDGLSGVLRDKKTYDYNGELYPGENIEDIIRENTSSMRQCKDALWQAAERADWYDNVTIILCQILSGAQTVEPKPETKSESETYNSTNNPNEEPNDKHKDFWKKSVHISKRNISVAILALVVIIGGLLTYILLRNNPSNNADVVDNLSDTTNANKVIKDKLQESLENGCAEFMKLTGKNWDDPYFKSIREKFDCDTIILDSLENKCKEFMKLTKIRTSQIQKINEEYEKNKNNQDILKKLNELKEKCINQEVSKTEFDKQLNEIQPQSGNEKIDKTIEPKEENNQNRFSPPADGQIQQEDSSKTNDELTPITTKIEIKFKITDYENFAKQRDSIVNLNKDKKCLGVFNKGGKKVCECTIINGKLNWKRIKEIHGNETYTLKFEPKTE